MVKSTRTLWYTARLKAGPRRRIKRNAPGRAKIVRLMNAHNKRWKGGVTGLAGKKIRYDVGRKGKIPKKYSTWARNPIRWDWKGVDDGSAQARRLLWRAPFPRRKGTRGPGALPPRNKKTGRFMKRRAAPRRSTRSRK